MNSFHKCCVRFGIDGLLERRPDWLFSRRIGLVTNDAARTARHPELPGRVALKKLGAQIIRLYSPEHGLLADQPDGAAVENGVDPLTGFEVVSLYGNDVGPSRQSLEDLETVVIDLPDVGSRFYTYIWTVYHVLETCAGTGIPVVLLDRPNPIGGDLTLAEGPILDVRRFGSFLGRASIPIRHGLTLGELARLWNSELALGVEIEIIQVENWRRWQHWPELGIPFKRTSPAMPSYETALTYPGLCLFEATNLSVGRGTESPFQMIGAPWLDAPAVADSFNAAGLRGVKAIPCQFSPHHPPFAGEVCCGVRVAVSEPAFFRPVRAGLRLLGIIVGQPEFRWSEYPTASNPSGHGHFERLIGCDGIRETLQQLGAEATVGTGRAGETFAPAVSCAVDSLGEHIERWTATADWQARAERILLYT